MALPLESSGFQDIVVVLGAAGLVIPAFAALRISPVVGFILVGVLVGPHGLALFAGQLPWLAALTISDASVLAAPAEMGIALLLFGLGLELSLERLRTMRHVIFGLGAAQLAACTVALGLLIWPLGLGWTATLALAAALSLSSTAVGLQMLSASGRMGSQTGRTAFGILLFQDLALAPLLLLIGAGSGGRSFPASIAISLGAIGVIVVAARLVVPPLFLQAARTRRPELFLAAALVVLIGSAAVAISAGLSPAVGALVAGLMLAETDYRRQIEAAIAPFQGLLLGVFLIWVGMRLDLTAIAAHPLLVLGAVGAVCAMKAAVIALVLRRARRGSGVAGHVALLLAAPSETSLVLLGAAVTAGLLAPGIGDTALIVASLSLAIAPLLGLLGDQIEQRSAPDRDDLPEATVPGRTVIIGFGRVGRLVGEMLEAHGKPWLAVDSDPDEVMRLRRAGQPVVYGDGRRPELLDALGLDTARAVVLTIDAPHSLETLVRLIRQRHPELCVVARARDADHAAQLYRLGVTDAVPETVESSLQVAEAVLVDLGVPMGLVIASIHEKRDALRQQIGKDMAAGQRPALRVSRLRKQGL